MQDNVTHNGATTLDTIYFGIDGGGYGYASIYLYLNGVDVLQPAYITYPQLFTGSTSNPTLIAATYTFVSRTTYNNYRLTATDVASTPEPSSLFLLGTGMLGIAGAARRKLYR